MSTLHPETRTSSRWLGYGIAVAIIGVVVVGAMAGALFSPAKDAPAGQSSPEDLRRRANRLFLQSQSMKDAEAWERTAEAYQQIVDENPEDGESWFRLGFALHFAKKYDEAIEANKVASTFERGKALSYYNIACSYALKDEPEAALDYLERAVEAGFRAQQPIENDVDMESLLDNPKFQELALAARPVSQKPERRQMDFWVGEWVIYSGLTDKKVGYDSVKRTENGFLLTENWTGVDNSTGRSFNYYDPVLKKWIHQWIDASGSTARCEGTWSDEDGKMTFVGQRAAADGQVIHMRMTFTPRPDRSIHQLIEQSSDGETWEKSFDAIYLPKGRQLQTRDSLGCLEPKQSLADPGQDGSLIRGST